mgnify:CR=1 FL=1
MIDRCVITIVGALFKSRYADVSLKHRVRTLLPYVGTHEFITFSLLIVISIVLYAVEFTAGLRNVCYLCIWNKIMPRTKLKIMKIFHGNANDEALYNIFALLGNANIYTRVL